MKWFIKCIKNYVNFTGRARRAEYWYFILFTFIFMIVARILDSLLFGENPMRILPSLFGLFVFLPQLAVMVRRLHDTGRSGKIVLWYYAAGFVWAIALMISGVSVFADALTGSFESMSAGFLILLFGGCLVFFVWAIFFLVWFCTKGTPGDNKYGPDPLAE